MGRGDDYALVYLPGFAGSLDFRTGGDLPNWGLVVAFAGCCCDRADRTVGDWASSRTVAPEIKSEFAVVSGGFKSNREGAFLDLVHLLLSAEPF